MIAVYGVIAAILILLLWGAILWGFAKLDEPYSRAEHVFQHDDGKADALNTVEKQHG